MSDRPREFMNWGQCRLEPYIALYYLQRDLLSLVGMMYDMSEVEPGDLAGVFERLAARLRESE